MKLVTRLTGLLTALPVMAACALVAAPAPCSGQGARESWQPPEEILDAIGVKPGMRVGEAGAGRGYFTFPLARRVGPRGVVFANDISTSSLDVIRDRAASEGLRNIEIVVGAAEDPRFPEKTLDMVVMVYVLHEVERRIPFLKSVRSYLKPGAPLVVIEGNTTGGSAHTPPFMTNRQVSETLTEAGYELDRIETFLPRDTIYISRARQTGTAIPEPQLRDERLRLDGTRLGEITQHDAMMLDFHVPRLVERLRSSGRIVPDAVSGLIDAARAAYGARDAGGLGVLYSVAGRDSAVEEVRRAATLAKELLPDFTYAEYPEMSHDGVWSKALISIFDFFDAHTGTSRPSASRPTAPEAIRCQTGCF